MKLILSSSSPARRTLLARLGIPFITSAPDIDETPLAGENVEAMVLRLAEWKAKKSANTHTEALIIGCDQVGVIDNFILTKPLTQANAIYQLNLVSGKMVRFFTAICLYNTKSKTQQLAVETYDVYFRELTNSMIEHYLEKEQPFNCAGSFQAEGLGIALIKKFSGEDYTALIGLPLIRLVSMLEKAGINPLMNYSA